MTILLWCTVLHCMLTTIFTYACWVSCAHEQKPHGLQKARSIGVANKKHYLWRSWAVLKKSKRTESSFSKDSSCVCVAQMPRSRDMVIFVPTTDDCFTPCACARGNNACSVWLDDPYLYWVPGKQWDSTWHEIRSYRVRFIILTLVSLSEITYLSRRGGWILLTSAHMCFNHTCLDRVYGYTHHAQTQ